MPALRLSAHCPACGRLITSLYRGGPFRSVPDGAGRSHEFIYLRRHNQAPGEECPGWSAPLLRGLEAAGEGSR